MLTNQMKTKREMVAFMNEAQLVKTIKTLVEKGDHAKEKAEQFYIAAGQHLKTLKEQCPSASAWEELVRRKCDLERSRAYELLQIADGRTTVAAVRKNGDARKAKSLRKLKSMSVSNGQTLLATIEPDDVPTEEEAEASYQETLYDQACVFLEEMTEETRQRFFAHAHNKDDDPGDEPADGMEFLQAVVYAADRAKLRKVAQLINDRLNHIKRSVALGKANRLPSKREAWERLNNPQQGHSWRVEVIHKDGERRRNGVRFFTYIEWQVQPQIGDATTEIIRCDDEPARCALARRRGAGVVFLFRRANVGCSTGDVTTRMPLFMLLTRSCQRSYVRTRRGKTRKQKDDRKANPDCKDCGGTGRVTLAPPYEHIRPPCPTCFQTASDRARAKREAKREAQWTNTLADNEKLAPGGKLDWYEPNRRWNRVKAQCMVPLPPDMVRDGLVRGNGWRADLLEYEVYTKRKSGRFPVRCMNSTGFHGQCGDGGLLRDDGTIMKRDEWCAEAYATTLEEAKARAQLHFERRLDGREVLTATACAIAPEIGQDPTCEKCKGTGLHHTRSMQTIKGKPVELFSELPCPDCRPVEFSEAESAERATEPVT
jgi:hypothetical protein